MKTSVCVSDLIQIDQMLIIIQSLRNIANTNALAVYTPKSDYPKVRQMATSVYVSATSNWSNVDYNLRLKKKYYKRVSCIYPKVQFQMATSVYVSDFK